MHFLFLNLASSNLYYVLDQSDPQCICEMLKYWLTEDAFLKLWGISHLESGTGRFGLSEFIYASGTFTWRNVRCIEGVSVHPVWL